MMLVWTGGVQPPERRVSSPTTAGSHRGLDLQVDGGELHGLGLGVAQGRVQGLGVDGGVEDGGLVGPGGRVGPRLGQHGDGVRAGLDGGRLQQLALGPLGGLGALLHHKLVVLVVVLLFVLGDQRVGPDLGVG